MLIETQTTPDANVLNFFPPVQLLKSGTAEFIDAKSLRKSPLAEHIFDLGGIKSIFIPHRTGIRRRMDWRSGHGQGNGMVPEGCGRKASPGYPQTEASAGLTGNGAQARQRTEKSILEH